MEYPTHAFAHQMSRENFGGIDHEKLNLPLVLLITPLAGSAFTNVVDDVVTLQQQGIAPDISLG